MAFRHRKLDGCRCSMPLWMLLTAIREQDHVRFRLNSGRRTMAEQAALVRKKGRYNPITNPGGAAVPSPVAPHIRVGRWDHALDIDLWVGDGVQGVIEAAAKRGYRLVKTVATEGWHVELHPGDRVRLAAWTRRRRRAEEERKRETLNTAGLALIILFEGFSSRPYKDAAGVWTIGYGSTKGVGPNTSPITRRQARVRLRREIEEAYAPVVRALNPPTRNAYSALVSFAYNVGPGALAPSTGVGRALRAKQWRTAADELLKWDRATVNGRLVRLLGLTRRRKAERALFLKGLK